MGRLELNKGGVIMKTKSHKMVIQAIQSGGATAESIIRDVGLKDMKELNAQFEVLTYLDLYAIHDDNGVYRLVDEDDYEEWKKQKNEELSEELEKKKEILLLKSMIKRKPDAKLRKLRLKQVKTFEEFSKAEDRAKANKDDRMIQLKWQIAALKFQLVQEEINQFAQQFADYFDGEETIDTVENISQCLMDRLNSLTEVKIVEG